MVSKQSHIIEVIHETLIELTKDVSNYFEHQTKKEVQVSLVEGQNTGYYYESGEIEFFESIPSEGVLKDIRDEVIGLDTKHYK